MLRNANRKGQCYSKHFNVFILLFCMTVFEMYCISSILLHLDHIIRKITYVALVLVLSDYWHYRWVVKVGRILFIYRKNSTKKDKENKTKQRKTMYSDRNYIQ